MERTHVRCYWVFNDVAVLFAGRFAHDAPDGLHYVHDGIARIEEHDGVERGHVHAFGEAAGIAQDAADAPALTPPYLVC